MGLLTNGSDSTYKAEDAVDELSNMIQRVLDNHQILAQRLLSIEIGINLSQPLTSNQGESLVNDAAAPPGQPRRNDLGYAFEEVLETSWVYKRAARQGEEGNFSIISAADRTASWSMLSGLSLSDISFIAVLALPVYEHDISNSEVYTFGEFTDEETGPVEVALSRPAESSTTKDIKKPGFSARLGRIAAGINFRPRPVDAPVMNINAPATGTGVFGQPLRQSVLYANVAISLKNAADESFIYGYIPIVVGKVCVFLKEEGQNHTLIILKVTQASNILLT